MGEWLGCASSSQRASSDPDGLALDLAIGSVLDDHISINSKELACSRIDIHNNGPISINSDIFSSNWQSSLRPLRDIAPVSYKVLLSELSRRFRAKIPAVNGGDICGLEVGSVLCAGAELEGSVACCVVVVVFSVGAGAFVKVIIGSHEEIGAGEWLSGSDCSNFVKLSVESVVELEADCGVIGLHVVRRAHGKMVEVKASQPPDVVNPACNVWHSVGLGR